MDKSGIEQVNIVRLSKSILGLVRGDVSDEDKAADLKELAADGVITDVEADALARVYIGKDFVLA